VVRAHLPLALKAGLDRKSPTSSAPETGVPPGMKDDEAAVYDFLHPGAHARRK